MRVGADLLASIFFAYALGLVVGNLLWAPYSGALAIGLVIGGFLLGLPLLAVAFLAGVLFPNSIRRRPLIWGTVAAVSSTAIWYLFDPPIDSSSTARTMLAATCAACAAIAFAVMIKRSRGAKSPQR